MGNSFFINWQDFHGYAVEKHIYHWGAVAAGQSTASGRRVCDAAVPFLRDQSQNCLQVAETLYRWRPGGFGRSVPPPTSGSLENATAMDSADCRGTSASPPLGPQENPGRVAAPLWASPRHGDDCPVVAAVAIGKPTTATTAQSLLARGAAADAGDRAQPSLDGGLQGLVSHRQRTTSRTLDGARFVQPVSLGRTLAARPALAANQGRIYPAFQAVRVAPDYSDRQRRPIRLDRTGGIVAFERVVDGFGNRGGVYPAWTSRRQRSPRTDAPGVQSGDNQDRGRDASRPATPDHLLGQLLQPASSAPSAGSSGAGKLVRQQPPTHSQARTALAVSSSLGTAAGPQQWGNQVAGPKTICRRSVCQTPDRSQADKARRAWRLFRTHPDRTSPRQRPRGHAPGSLPIPERQIAKSQSVTYVLTSKCYPCPDTVPTPALSLGERENHLPPPKHSLRFLWL